MLRERWAAICNCDIRDIWMESDGEPTQSVCVTCCCMTHIVCVQYGQMVTEWSWPPQVAPTHTVVLHIQEKEMFILIRYIIIDYLYNKYFDKCNCRGGGHILFSMLWNTLVIQWALGSNSSLWTTYHTDPRYQWYDSYEISILGITFTYQARACSFLC